MKEELNEFQKAGLDLNDEEEKRLIGIASYCGVGTDSLIKAIIGLKTNDIHSKLNLVGEIQSGESLKEVIEEIKEDYQNIILCSEKSKKKKQNWKKKNFYD